MLAVDGVLVKVKKVVVNGEGVGCRGDWCGYRCSKRGCATIVVVFDVKDDGDSKLGDDELCQLRQ